MADVKIVYNACYGGFGLSREATMRYAELKGITLYPEETEYGYTLYWKVPEGKGRDKYGALFMESDIDRDDPALVQVVEELGEKASGRCARLEIETVPNGTRYRIQEYDGNEYIETADDVNWSVA